jgi:hypothetical protein
MPVCGLGLLLTFTIHLTTMFLTAPSINRLFRQPTLFHLHRAVHKRTLALEFFPSIETSIDCRPGDKRRLSGLAWSQTRSMRKLQANSEEWNHDPVVPSE